MWYQELGMYSILICGRVKISLVQSEEDLPLHVIGALKYLFIIPMLQHGWEIKTYQLSWGLVIVQERTLCAQSVKGHQAHQTPLCSISKIQGNRNAGFEKERSAWGYYTEFLIETLEGVNEAGI